MKNLHRSTHIAAQADLIVDDITIGGVFLSLERLQLSKSVLRNFAIIQILLFLNNPKDLGRVVQSIVSLTSSLRGQLVKCFMTL